MLHMKSILLFFTLFSLSHALPGLSAPESLGARNAGDGGDLNDWVPIDVKMRDWLLYWGHWTPPQPRPQDTIDLINSMIALDKVIKQATTEYLATSASSISTTQTQDVINYITSPLEPDLRAAVNAAIAKKSSINTSGYKQTFQQQFKWIQGNTTALGQAFLAKVPATGTLRSAASSAVAKLNADTASLVAVAA